jgi:chromosome segregation ATPase
MTQPTDVNNSTFKRVYSVCERLIKEGTRPSVRLVLSELPEVSSTSTVHRYFKQWKDEYDINQQSLHEKLGFSSDFTKAFMKEISRFSIEIEQRYKILANDVGEQRDAAVAALENIENHIDKNNKEIGRKVIDIQLLKDELKSTQQDMEAQLITSKEVNNATVSELREQLKQALHENKSLTSLNEDIRNQKIKAELRLEGNQEYTDEVKAQNTLLRQDNKELNTSLSKLNGIIAGLESTVRGNEKLIVQLKSQIK